MTRPVLEGYCAPGRHRGRVTTGRVPGPGRTSPASSAHTGLSWNELCPARADGSEGGTVPRLTRDDFEHLLAFRTSLRQFQHWSEEQAQAAGLTHVQHQLLVAVKGHPGNQPPTVGELADYLLLRHHSAVELVDRAAAAGLVRRVADPSDGRVVRVQLTPLGEQRLAELTPAHLDELHRLADVLNQLTTGWNGRADPRE
jgi:DNA-binding MarR family transcriptional regulator